MVNFHTAMKALRAKAAAKAMKAEVIKKVMKALKAKVVKKVVKKAMVAKKARTATKKKKLAPAWISGGSSSRPRIGKALVTEGPARKEKGVRGPQQAAKKGTALLLTRSKKVPANRSVPYVPSQQQSGEPKRESRKATSKAKLKLQTLLNMSEQSLIKMMWRMGHLEHRKKGHQCPKCKKGKLSVLKKSKSRLGWQQQCGGCKQWVVPHFGSAVFSVGHGSSWMPLQKQAGILFCAVWDIEQSKVPCLIEDVEHHRVDAVYKAWRHVLKQYVKATQSKIKMGSPSGSAPDQYEVDEAVFRKEDIGDNQVQWQEMVGLKRRGDRKSLVLHKRTKENSVSSRAQNGRAVPPPMSKPEWTKLRKKHVGANALGHSDGAPAYKSQGKGQLHDSVSHSGKNKQYTKVTTHEDAEGNQFKSVAGTQSLDGWWAHGKRATRGVNARYSDQVEAHIHTEQWQHWQGNQDRWEEAGKVLSWIPE